MVKPAVLLSILMAASAAAHASPELVRDAKCLTCHTVDKRLVGPSFRDVAAKYGNDKTAVDRLASKLRKGGSGVWGPVPMPPIPQLTEAQAKQLAQWVLEQR